MVDGRRKKMKPQITSILFYFKPPREREKFSFERDPTTAAGEWENIVQILREKKNLITLPSYIIRQMFAENIICSKIICALSSSFSCYRRCTRWAWQVLFHLAHIKCLLNVMFRIDAMCYNDNNCHEVAPKRSWVIIMVFQLWGNLKNGLCWWRQWFERILWENICSQHVWGVLSLMYVKKDKSRIILQQTMTLWRIKIYGNVNT